MDAVKFLKEKNRMTKDCGISCKDCPLSCDNNGIGISCRELRSVAQEKYVSIVEKWSKAHKKKTRQSELLKLLPNVAMNDGVIDICPNVILKIFECPYNGGTHCRECQKEFWLEEVEEEE